MYETYKVRKTKHNNNNKKKQTETGSTIVFSDSFVSLFNDEKMYMTM